MWGCRLAANLSDHFASKAFISSLADLDDLDNSVFLGNSLTELSGHLLCSFAR